MNFRSAEDLRKIAFNQTGPQEAAPLPVAPSQRPAWEQWKESKWESPWTFLDYSSSTHLFSYLVCSIVLPKDGSCHLSLYTDTVAQLKKKAASEQICFYIDLIRHLPGAQICAWCCQGYGRFMRHSLWLQRVPACYRTRANKLQCLWVSCRDCQTGTVPGDSDSLGLGRGAWIYSLRSKPDESESGSPWLRLWKTQKVVCLTSSLVRILFWKPFLLFISQVT